MIEVVVPTPAKNSRGIYAKVAERGERDFALASAAIQVTLVEGVVEHARIALGGVAPVPWRAAKVEELLLGQRLTEDVIQQVSLAATAGDLPPKR